MDPITLSLLIVLGIAIFWAIILYNSLVTGKNRVEEAWSDIEVQLKRRYNLIPNLIETVKGYATHEKEVFQRVTEARTQAISAENPHDQAQAENNLSSALKSIFAVAENYPDLRASENFRELQKDLTDTEDKIQAARRFYNGMVRDFNTRIQHFPNNLVAGLFKFNEKEFFEVATAEERKNPQVSF